MELMYLGHSSFRMKFKSGMVLVTDPFDSGYVGLAFPKQKADIVTVSHDYKDHNFVEGVTDPVKREDIFVINEEGEYEVGGVEVTAMKDGEENLIMVIRQNGISLCHLGDLNHNLTEKEIDQIGAIDVLLVPVGGEKTVSDKNIEEIISNMSPSIVVPMHYKAKGMKDEFKTLREVDEFTKSSSLEVMIEGENRIKIDVNSLPENTKIAVLSPKN
jgi:L-ascorbate metabolism protein UlaG (beta-lactamase superfamily)